MALMEISVLPIGTKVPSIGDYIADLVRLLDQEGASYELTDMGTVIEGEIGSLLELAAKLHETPFKTGIMRVVTNIEIDDRRDKKVKLREKVASVKARL